MYKIKIQVLITGHQKGLRQSEKLIQSVCDSFETSVLIAQSVGECEVTFQETPQLSVVIVRDLKKFRVAYNLLKIFESTFDICRSFGTSIEVLEHTLEQ